MYSLSKSTRRLASLHTKSSTARSYATRPPASGSEEAKTENPLPSPSSRDSDISKSGPAPDRNASANSEQQDQTSSSSDPKQAPHLTFAQRDEALKRALEDMSGDGGSAGLELEDGQPVAMKRGVRSNMFRYI
ncbi:hypothetical protein OE88DRAFT_1736625 [Heliocybe sulcata]|uniref:Uncharacterized protein n=1 Tax=Heliocybe sulcata TaxID=5364 RepID=A0A5C3MXK9_9AGAM|nr:hypothetical protein OE88DRAFT_1736625 [Heliocybe sulcata]